MNQLKKKNTIHPLKLSWFFFKNYCYFITNVANEAILIDPAWELGKIKQYIKSNNISLKGILITHSHFDHTNLSKSISSKYKVPVYISKIESDTYQFNLPNLIKFEPDQAFIIDSFEILPISTPGHTKGSICYLIDKYLFTGDTLFIEGCGHCKSRGGDADELYLSLRKIVGVCSDDTLIYPGHCYGTAVGQSLDYLKRNNVYLGFKDSISFVKFRNRKNSFSWKEYKWT